MGQKLESRLAIWKLTPIDVGQRNWGASTYKEQVVVRAADERDARLRAQRAFQIATYIVPGTEIALCPWQYPDMVRAERLDEGQYEEEGPNQILEPDWAESEIK